MAVEILSLIHNATTLLFGVYISAAFLGIRMNRKNIFTLFGFSCCVGVVYVTSYILFSTEGTEKIYPLIVHIPLALFLTLYYKYKPALSALSVLTAYLCCQISNWMGIAAENIVDKQWVYYTVRIIVTVAVFVLLMRYISAATAVLLQKPTASIIILGIMPLVYYIFDYAAGVYTGLLYSGLKVVVEFLGFVLCVFYILFIFLYFRQYEEKRDAEQKTQIMEMKRAQSEKEIEALRRSEYAVSILRHDIRHFLLNISSYISNGQTEKAQKYISDIIDATDKTATHKYSKNEIVNMILSSFEERISENGIDFEHFVDVPQKLIFPDVDLTAILSNALENAVKAVSKLQEGERKIIFDMYMSANKLLISVKNSFSGQIKFVDGLPTTEESGHGIGTQSIRYVTEKLKGNCQFSVADGMFVLQVIL